MGDNAFEDKLFLLETGGSPVPRYIYCNKCRKNVVNPTADEGFRLRRLFCVLKNLKTKVHSVIYVVTLYS